MRTAPRSRAVEIEARPILPWAYIVTLLVELTVLATLVAIFGKHAPRSYEAGWVGAGSMIAMQVYSLRRRLRVLRNVGSLRTWLDLHIFLGFQGYILVGYHSVGITLSTSLAAINFALVTIVVLTGVIGRHLYSLTASPWFARWSLVHKPLSVVLLGITTLHVLAHYAYAT